MQESLWVLDQLDPGSSVYNMPLAIRLTGMLDLAALNRTLNEIVARHEPLRTKLGVRDGQPVQVIEAVRPWELTVVDLAQLAAVDREASRVARARLAVAAGSTCKNGRTRSRAAGAAR